MRVLARRADRVHIDTAASAPAFNNAVQGEDREAFESHEESLCMGRRDSCGDIVGIALERRYRRGRHVINGRLYPRMAGCLLHIVRGEIVLGGAYGDSAIGRCGGCHAARVGLNGCGLDLRNEVPSGRDGMAGGGIVRRAVDGSREGRKLGDLRPVLVLEVKGFGHRIEVDYAGKVARVWVKGGVTAAGLPAWRRGSCPGRPSNRSRRCGW